MKKTPANQSHFFEEIKLITPPRSIFNQDYISDLRLWAQVNSLPFNSAAQASFLYGGPSPSNQPSGTYLNGRYDDEFYPSTLTVENTVLESFAQSENPFLDAFYHWTDMSAYPSLRGQGYGLGPAFKIVSDSISPTSPAKSFCVAAANIQWLWLWFYPPEDTSNTPNFNVRLTLIIEEGNSVISSNSETWSNPLFGRMTLRSRQEDPKYKLRINLELIDEDENSVEGVAPFRIGGRLGKFHPFGFTSTV